MGFGHKIKRRSRKSVLNKGRAESFPCLQPIQVERLMLGTDPNIPVEKKDLSLGLETCPNLRCHKKGSRGKNTRHSRKGKRPTLQRERTFSKKESLKTLRSFPIPYSIRPLA